ncbi:sensor histidine kinase [Desulfuribacillus alkaliarsenatis]|uniref:histidine kinase n=1 Tax=Desulfuribacillus alkaliarsenatis TaxID=766136 RepID=A0A1E5G2T6_9FIRM|nr:HAMP domain-containing sensor histidine kinase [Desulfuribacillus alkaliarsenatis]OEF97386.1 histidine kinase [Desulfuribacillus alkaliarsenatis]
MNEQQSNKAKGVSISDKIRSSLVIKLNLRMLAILLSAFMSINTLLLIIVSTSTIYQIEKGAIQLAQDVVATENAIAVESYEVLGYRITGLDVLTGQETEGEGYQLPWAIQKRTPIKDASTTRNILTVNWQEDMMVAEWIRQIDYELRFTVENQTFLVVYNIGEDLARITVIAIIVLAVELLLLISSLFKGSTAIRKTLKPISEMAETAKALNEQVANIGAGGKDITSLAGAISSIDASQLDKRIAVDESQKELKELAQAINHMLNRINASYQSQVRFVSDASHELRTPISVIQGYVNLLDRWGKKDEKTLQESIDAIKDETESMKTLVEQLLFLARGDNSTMQLNKQSFDVQALIDEIVREAQMIDSAHVFKTKCNTVIAIKADRQLMKQAIRILLDNSIKYTPAGEVISLKTYSENNKLHIVVQDNGIGIPPEDVPRIFDRFYRSDESRARKTGGSGLGLAIARIIVEQHDGHFEVISRQEIGTRTTIVLPLENKPTIEI